STQCTPGCMASFTFIMAILSRVRCRAECPAQPHMQRSKRDAVRLQLGGCSGSAALAERGVKGHPAVYEECGSDDVIGQVRGKPRRGVGNVFGLTDAAVGNEL